MLQLYRMLKKGSYILRAGYWGIDQNKKKNLMNIPTINIFKHTWLFSDLLQTQCYYIKTSKYSFVYCIVKMTQ